MWKSDLEHLVENDMIEHGYNPESLSAIQLYWEWYFNGN